MNRRVLLICYYFPPLGLGGIGRPLNLFKKLPDHGWDCDILTVKPVAYRAYEPELLDSLNQDHIFRSGSRDPQRLLYLLGVRSVKSGTISKTRPVSEKFFPDSKVGWVKPAIRMGRKLCRRNKYDAIISTSPPISSHLIGASLSSEFDLRWLADFRDYWTTTKVDKAFSSERMIARGNELLKQIRKDASVLTTVNKTIADYLGEAEIITNGYDSDLAQHWQSEPDEELFTIGLPGHQHDNTEIEPLLELLARLRDHHPVMYEKTQLLQVGQVDVDWFKRRLADYDLSMQVDLSGHLSREDTIRKLSRAHLFYFGASQPGQEVFLPGRLFELLASGRSLIACTAAESEVAGTLRGLERSFCFEPKEIDSALAFLVGRIEAFQSGTYRFEPLPEDARCYSSDMLASNFARLLNRLV